VSPCDSTATIVTSPAATSPRTRVPDFNSRRSMAIVLYNARTIQLCDRSGEGIVDERHDRRVRRCLHIALTVYVKYPAHVDGRALLAANSGRSCSSRYRSHGRHQTCSMTRQLVYLRAGPAP